MLDKFRKTKDEEHLEKLEKLIDLIRVRLVILQVRHSARYWRIIEKGPQMGLPPFIVPFDTILGLSF